MGGPHPHPLLKGSVTVLSLLLLIPFPTVLCWGKDGHYAICKITQVTITMPLFNFLLPKVLKF